MTESEFSNLTYTIPDPRTSHPRRRVRSREKRNGVKCLLGQKVSFPQPYSNRLDRLYTEKYNIRILLYMARSGGTKVKSIESRSFRPFLFGLRHEFGIFGKFFKNVYNRHKARNGMDHEIREAGANSRRVRKMSDKDSVGRVGTDGQDFPKMGKLDRKKKRY